MQKLQLKAHRANAAGSHLLGQTFLHRSRVPLSEAPIDHVTAAEWAARKEELPAADAPVPDVGELDRVWRTAAPPGPAG
ncbi:hypothetical protein ACIQGO_26455 [Streptomyces shenzhenensis]|uniref:hypothetical protein n=1 Tax=Streptomyces shenzhenensis TaxID=943815 RepID=UPI00382F2947